MIITISVVQGKVTHVFMFTNELNCTITLCYQNQVVVLLRTHIILVRRKVHLAAISLRITNKEVPSYLQ